MGRTPQVVAANGKVGLFLRVEGMKKAAVVVVV